MDMLYAKTFMIVGSMLCLTAITAKINRYFETGLEMIVTIISSFVILFAILFFSDSFPLNLFLVGAFSLVVGWSIGPSIEYYGMRYKLRSHLKSKGTPLKKGERASSEQIMEFESSFDKDMYHKQWQNIIFQAILGTAIAVFLSAFIVFTTDIDFSFLGMFLFISLIILIIMGLLNLFIFKSGLFSLVQAYIGAVIFTLYLLYDFNRLEALEGDDSWSTAISISVSIYLDIINLFLDLLEILSESN